MPEAKQFHLIQYYNTVVNYLEENKVSSEEGNKRIDRFVVACLDNEYQTFFKEPIFLTDEAFKKLEECFFEEFKPIFKQYYKPVNRAGGFKHMNEGTYRVSFNEKESDMTQDPHTYLIRSIKDGIKINLKPQAIKINEAALKKAEEEGTDLDEGCSPYIEFVLEDKGNRTKIFRQLCTGFKLTESIGKQIEGAVIGEYKITDHRVDKEKCITYFTLTPLPETDPLQKLIQEATEKVLSDLQIGTYQVKDLTDIRFTGQPEYPHQSGEGICQVPEKFWDQQYPQLAIALGEVKFPEHLIDVIELRTEKEMGYSDSDKQFIYVHLRKKIDGGETE